MIFSNSFEVARQTFLESLKVRSFSPATLASYGQSLDVFFRFLGQTAIEDLRSVAAPDAAAYVSWLMAQGWTTWTVHARLQALKRFYEHLERTDMVFTNPCSALVLPRMEKRLPRVILTRAEVREVLDTPDTQTRVGIRDKAILEVFYSTGIRLEEMTQLLVFDVDTRGGFLRVNKGKFAKDRVVPLGAKASRYVEEYLRQVRSEWSRNNRDERSLWLSSRTPHEPIKKQVIEVMVKNYGKKAGLRSRLTPHVWRHTCATHLVSSGSNIAYVQRLLGHRSLKTTQIYTRVTAREVKETFARAHPDSKRKIKTLKLPASRRGNPLRMALFRRK